MWELWKRRNNRRHGKEVRYEYLLQQTMVSIHRFQIEIHMDWDTKRVWGNSSQANEIQIKNSLVDIRWEISEQGWMTCNTDGASKENSGENSYAFCIKNANGDLISAEARCIGIATNIEAEATVILMTLRRRRDLNLHNIILETDSLSLRKIIMDDSMVVGSSDWRNKIITSYS